MALILTLMVFDPLDSAKASADAAEKSAADAKESGKETDDRACADDPEQIDCDAGNRE